MADRLDTDIRYIIEEAAQTMGCHLWGTEFVAHGRGSLLRVYIDKVDAEIDIDDCVKVSRQLDLMLAVQDSTPRGYRLEVSSPGLDRKFFTLEQLASYQEAQLRVSLINQVNGKRRLQGVLKQVNSEEKSFSLNVEDELINIPFSAVKVARLHVDFEI